MESSKESESRGLEESGRPGVGKTQRERVRGQVRAWLVLMGVQGCIATAR